MSYFGLAATLLAAVFNVIIANKQNLFPMIVKRILLLFIFFFSTLAKAESLPAELMYKEQPIDPICLEFQDEGSNYINIAKCKPAKSFDEFNIINKNPPEGFIGYEYTYKYAHNISYSYYKYLGKINKLIVLHIKSASGGTGRFSYINFIERKGNKIRLVRGGAGGDRASGIKEAKVENNRLIYLKGLTASEIISLVDKGSSKEDLGLEYCAVCEKAIAHYRNDKLVYVEFAKNYVNLSPNPNAIRQQCFDKIYNRYVEINKTKLTQEQLKDFVDQFKIRCMKDSD